MFGSKKMTVAQIFALEVDMTDGDWATVLGLPQAMLSQYRGMAYLDIARTVAGATMLHIYDKRMGRPARKVGALLSEANGLVHSNTITSTTGIQVVEEVLAYCEGR